MLEKADSLLLHELSDHVAEDSTHGIESLICSADIAQANVIEENFLHDEDSNSFAQLGTGLHNAKTERDDLRGQQEVNHVRRIIFHQCADDTQRCESEIFKGTGFGGGIEERVEEKRDVSWTREKKRKN